MKKVLISILSYIILVCLGCIDEPSSSSGTLSDTTSIGNRGASGASWNKGDNSDTTDLDSAVYDTTDFILVAYKLTAEQSGQFNTANDSIGSFWKKWDSAGAQLDYISLLPETHGTTNSILGFDGDGDCRLRIQAAYTDSGLLLLYDIIDDSFIDEAAGVPDGSEWMIDAIESKLAGASLDELFAKSDSLPTIDSMLLISNTCVQKVGSMGLVASQSSDPLALDPCSLSQLEKRRIQLKVIEIAVDHRLIEWFIPWSQVVDTATENSYGDEFAFIVGYDDIDVGETAADLLRWKSPCDVFCPESTWGEIKLGPVLE